MYKECFKLMDVDKDGTLSKNDLRAAFDNVGKLMDESELDSMLGEVGGSCTFDAMVKMFQEKMAGGKYIKIVKNCQKPPFWWFLVLLYALSYYYSPRAGENFQPNLPTKMCPLCPGQRARGAHTIVCMYARLNFFPYLLVGRKKILNLAHLFAVFFWINANFFPNCPFIPLLLSLFWWNFFFKLFYSSNNNF